ncbi:uncharacterized protein LOC119364444 [Triticum dicoccoides]|uniref:uncharacterized protein LOC119364444 n=1 Tax=Triticum dicoccoides TaxID=85692 RepID=UPI001890A56C|nr:uncharacterized protein LOC119364444 [Triticum dicoccoides]XP_037485816.1 uncharacterized protein LOC119364444 [Triticum dicoccoides]
MAAVVSWYGPLIDLSAAAGHVGGFVQFLVSVRRVLPHQEQNAATGRTYHRIILEVGDDTRSSFSVSLWSNNTSSTIVAGDVLLLQNIKIVEFRNGLEGRASQMSAVQILMNSKDLVQPEGIDEFIINCKVGNATRSKLRRVSEWIVHTKRTCAENHQQVMSKNWKERMKNDTTDFLSISELLPQSKPCNLNIYASIGKIVLMGSLSLELKGQSSVIEKHSLSGHNDIVRDFITTGCKLCGLPLYQKNLHGDSTYPIDCPDNPKYLHVIGQIYKPFMIYVQDQTGQVPVLVKNKVAEALFSNISADDVSECYKSRHCTLVGTCESGHSSTSGMLDGTGKIGIAKRKRTKRKLDFHLIWLIVMKCLLNQGKNSPFCFQISVNPGKNVEDGRFELVSLTMPIP